MLAINYVSITVNFRLGSGAASGRGRVVLLSLLRHASATPLSTVMKYDLKSFFPNIT